MSTSRIVVEGFVNKQIFPRTKVKSGDFAIFTFSPEIVIGEIDKRTKNTKYKTDDITFKGRVPELDGGTRYKITADLKQDAKYGWQYDIVSINSVVKLDTEADVRKFLGYVFTENQINALYEAYPNPVEILERGDIEALCKIKGIKEAKAAKLLNKYNASKDSSKAYTTLSEFGLSKATIDRLVEHYGSADILAEKVKNNPYALIGEGVRIGWSKADSMALRKGIPTNSQFRINAYALYYLRNLAEVDGHTWVPLEALGSGIKGLSADISTEMVKRELQRMVENKTLFYDKETKRIGLMKYRKLEEMICRELLRLQDAECRKMEFVEETIAECEETVGFQYTEEQKDAIRNLVNKNVILMTALAGSGKTTLMYPVSRIFRKNGLEFGICALSGKASLNLHEITKEDGMTIHRLLGWNPKFGGPTFTKKNPLKTDVVILDEVSMVGGELFYSLISAIRDGGRLIMLGDPGQLESIGLCNLISDIQNSGKITNVKLTKIFRQAQRSGIITDSHKVYNQVPIIPPKFHGEEIHGELKDLKIIAKSSSEECLEEIKKEFKRLHFDENIPIEDILILSAKRSIGDLSGRSINREIQSMIKFEDESPLKLTYSDGIKYDVLYHVGDRVIVTKNNYEVKTPDGGLTEIFNGNIGTVVAKDNFRRQLIVRLAQGDVIIEGDMLLELQLGYAISCHKAQGSGFPYVIVACDPGAYQLLTKQWLYTALSRAKKYCVLVGTDKSINQCIKTDRVTRKSTWLSELLMFPKEFVVLERRIQRKMKILKLIWRIKKTIMETTEIKLHIIKSRKEDFVEDEPIWVGRYYYPKCKVGTTETIHNSRSISNAISILFDSFGSTYAWNFIARQSDCTKEEFIQEILSVSRSVVEKLLAEDEKKRTKYPIDELYYLRYDLWDSDEAGEHRHPCEVVKDLGGKELRFEGCPMGDCDYILAQFDKPPVFPKYIEDYSTDKEEKDRIKKEFPEFILEE